VATGRLTGDWFSAHFPPVNLVRGSGLLAGSGLLLVLFAQHPVLALLGFACVGAGLSTIVPMVFSAAGRGEVLFGEDQNTKADPQGHKGHYSGTVGSEPCVLNGRAA
jgi:hypothetical protein